MEFKEAMRIWKRMCKAADEECESCQMYDFCGACVSAQSADKAEATLAKWAAEHPEKTIAEDFLEKLPKAVVWENGTPTACALDCGYGQPDICKRDIDICADCWRRPFEEQDNGKS